MSRRRLIIPGTGGVLFKSSAGDQAGSVFDLLTKPVDIVSLAPAAQIDLNSEKVFSLSAFLLFDFKYLEDLGVTDVLALP